MITPVQLDTDFILKSVAAKKLNLTTEQCNWLLGTLGVSPVRIGGILFLTMNDFTKLQGSVYLKQAREQRPVEVKVLGLNQLVAPSNQG